MDQPSARRLDVGARPDGRAADRRGGARAVITSVALALGLTGCAGAGPDGAGQQSSVTVAPTMTRADAATAMQDYDSRHAAALAGSVASFDPVPWSKADTGMLYARRRLDTAVRKVEGDRRTTAVTHAVRAVYAPALTGYPAHAILDLGATSGGRTSSVLSAVTRHDADSPWLMTSMARYTLADLPEPPRPGSESTLTTEEQSRLLAGVRELARQLTVGEGELVTGELANLAGEFIASDGRRAEFRLWSTETDQFGPRGSIQAVGIEGTGTLALVNLVAETTHRADPGGVLDTTVIDDPYLEATGQRGTSRSQIVLRNGVTAVVMLDSKGMLRTLTADAAGLPL